MPSRELNGIAGSRGEDGILNKATLPGPFGCPPIELFRRGLVRLISSDLGGDPEFAEGFARAAARELSSGSEAALPNLAAMLAASGLRESWNRILRDERSAVLGRWVAAHITGSVLDLLCGDGGVGEWLWRRGIPVVLCEREAIYREVDREAHQAPFVTFESLEVNSVADTVLVSTVLHHEPEPDQLLQMAAAIGRERLVIVENCVEDDVPDDYHLLMDIFFNRCLNEFDVPAIAQHRTAASWLASASRFGNPKLCERRDQLPGIPLPHHLIVVDLVGGLEGG